MFCHQILRFGPNLIGKNVKLNANYIVDLTCSHRNNIQVISPIKAIVFSENRIVVAVRAMFSIYC